MQSARPQVGGMLTGTAVYAMAQFMTVVALARLGGAEAVGEYSLALAVTAPPFLLAGLGLRKLIAVDDPSARNPTIVLGVRLVAGVLAFFLSLLVALVWSAAQDYIAAITMVAAAKYVEHQSDVTYGYLQKHSQNGIVGRSLVLRGIWLPCGAVIGWQIGGSVAAAAATIALGWLVVLVLHDYRARRSVQRDSELTRYGNTRSLVRAGAVLGLTAFVVSLAPNAPRYFLQQSHGTEALGVYTVLSYAVVSGAALMNALGQAYVASLAASVDGGWGSAATRTFRALVGLAVVGSVTSALGALLVGDLVLRFVFGPEFVGWAGSLAMMLLLGMLNYLSTLYNYLLTARRIYGRQLLAGIVAALVAVMVSSVLVPALGVMGAVFAFGATYLAQFLTQVLGRPAPAAAGA